jgi:homoserine dehydrogenase
MVCPNVGSDEIISLKNDDTQSEAQSITIGAVERAKRGPSDKAKTSFADEQLAVASKGGLSNVFDTVFRNECTLHAIFDCTNDEIVSRYHADWLRAGIDVITANNRGLSGPKHQREDIKEAEKWNGKQSGVYMRETVVAGGLPIINTLRSLVSMQSWFLLRRF